MFPQAVLLDSFLWYVLIFQLTISTLQQLGEMHARVFIFLSLRVPLSVFFIYHSTIRAISCPCSDLLLGYQKLSHGPLIPLFSICTWILCTCFVILINHLFSSTFSKDTNFQWETLWYCRNSTWSHKNVPIDFTGPMPCQLMKRW